MRSSPTVYLDAQRAPYSYQGMLSDQACFLKSRYTHTRSVNQLEITVEKTVEFGGDEPSLPESLEHVSMIEPQFE